MLLNYAKYTSVAGCNGLLSNLRTFATTYGWTVPAYGWQPAKMWGADLVTDPSGDTYDWVVAASSYASLYLNHTGYGGQTNKFLLNSHAWTDATPRLYVVPIDGYYGSSRTLSQASGTQPYRQIGNFRSIPKNVGGMDCGDHADIMDELYLFGDEHFLMAVLNMDGVFCQFIQIGQHEMFDTSTTNGCCYGFFGQYGYGQDGTWQQHADSSNSQLDRGSAFFPATVSSGSSPDTPIITADIQWDDSQSENRPLTEYWYTTGFVLDKRLMVGFYGSTGVGEPSSVWTQWTYALGSLKGTSSFDVAPLLNVNNWSGRRMLMKAVNYGQSRVDDTWKPIGRTPYYFLPFTGLSIGETISYGSEEYMVFPIGRVDWKWGVAFRVA